MLSWAATTAGKICCTPSECPALSQWRLDTEEKTERKTERKKKIKKERKKETNKIRKKEPVTGRPAPRNLEREGAPGVSRGL